MFEFHNEAYLSSPHVNIPPIGMPAVLFSAVSMPLKRTMNFTWKL